MSPKKQNKEEIIADFLYEVGTLRKISRMHRQALLTDDLSDNIASHSFRVAIIAWCIANSEGLDVSKTVLMALVHDIGETRTNDHNWIHKRYVKSFDDEVLDDQFSKLPYKDFKELAITYEKRKSEESHAVKDADLVEQLLTLREYEWQGNKEASIWLRGKDGKENKHMEMLHFDSSKELSKAIYKQDPSDWWSGIWTNNNR